MSSSATSKFGDFWKRVSREVSVLDKIVRRFAEPLEGNVLYKHQRLGVRRQDDKVHSLWKYVVSETIEAKSSKNTIDITEIGFNAGHSAVLFLEMDPRVILHSFDIATHKYTKPCAEYLASRYHGRFFFHVGDSSKTLPVVLQQDYKLDVVFIDGGHRYTDALCDLRNVSRFFYKGTLCIVDDINFPQVRRAWNDFQSELPSGYFKILYESSTQAFSTVK